MGIRRQLIAALVIFGCLWSCDDSTDSSPAHPVDGQSQNGDATIAQDNEQTIPRDSAVPDANADASDLPYIPEIADERPTPGEADLPGATRLTAPVPEGQSRAGRVQDEAEKLTGPEANCRLGDFRMDNAVISICIQAETTFSQLSFAGGNIIDAHRADRPGTDSFREFVFAPGLGEVSVDSIGIVKDGSEGGMAVIRTVGTADGARIVQGVIPNSFVPPKLEITTEYRLLPDTDAVEILSWLSAGDSEGGLFLVMDLVFFGDRNRDFRPEIDPDVPGTPMPYVGAIGPETSYAWFWDGGAFALFALADLGIPGAPVQYGTMTIRPGDLRLLKRTLRIGTGDIESLRPIPDGAFPIQISGTPRTDVVIETPDERAITQVKLDEEGQGQVRLESGDYVAHTHNFAGGDIDVPFTANGTPLTVELAQPLPATVRVDIRDSSGMSLGAKVTFEGDGNVLRFVVGSESIQLPPGVWSVTVTRGWHYSVHQSVLDLEPGAGVDLNVVLDEEISLSGFASGEFHQHASPSFDSQVPVEQRVLSNIAEGVDFMCPSEHDIIYDYRGLVERMGLTELIAVPLTGVEISPRYTHLGAYGIRYDPHIGAGGAPEIPFKGPIEWGVRRVPELIRLARDGGARVIQVNHPRASQGYFDHVGYHSHVPIDSLDPEEFSSDFDSLEVFNGAGDFCQVTTDWLGLLNQGLVTTAIGNSDTHYMDRPTGYPRNYLPTNAVRPQEITSDEVAEALLTGRVTIGGGAVMDFPDGQVGPGDTLTGNREALTVRLRIRTPSHTAIHRLIALVNGVPVLDQRIDSVDERLVDFDGEVSVPVTEDAHVVFLAVGDERLRFVNPGQPVFAMSNPIWVDLDGDGVEYVGPGALERLALPFCRQ